MSEGRIAGSRLLIAGENISAGDSVVESLIDGKAYIAGPVAGEYVGNAEENIREGFRVSVTPSGEVREDDA